MTAAPPAPIWADDASGLTVWVNGAMLELSMGCDGWSGRLEIAETAELLAGFAQAIAEATAWAARWNTATRSYDEAAAA